MSSHDTNTSSEHSLSLRRKNGLTATPLITTNSSYLCYLAVKRNLLLILPSFLNKLCHQYCHYENFKLSGNSPYGAGNTATSIMSSLVEPITFTSCSLFCAYFFLDRFLCILHGIVLDNIFVTVRIQFITTRVKRFGVKAKD